MARGENVRLKYFNPSKEIRKYMAKRLQFARLELEKTMAGEELSDDERLFQKRLATDKARLLDKISQEMADLLFFFESIASHKELQDLFDNDLQDLMGLKQERQESTALHNGKNYPIFFQPNTLQRLIVAMLAVDAKNDQSFRLSLPYMLQQIIYSKIERQRPPDMTEEISSIMLSDISRTLAWTKLYASDFKVDDLGYHRALGYSFRPIISCRSYNDEIEQRGKIL